jgi:hypothetical protein
MSIGLLQLGQQDIRYADIYPNSAKVGRRFSQLISDNYCSSRLNHRVVLDEGKAKMTGVVAAMRKLITTLNTMVAKNEGWRHGFA